MHRRSLLETRSCRVHSMPHKFYSVASRDGYKPAVCGCSSEGLNFWVRNNTKTLNPNKEVLLSEPFPLLLIVPVILLIIHNYTLQLLKLECCLQIDLGEHKETTEGRVTVPVLLSCSQ